eukprot:gene2839-4245_t
MVKTLIIFYSTYGHIYSLVKAAAEGAKSVEGAEVTIMKVKETLSPELLAQIGGDKAAEQWKDVPVVTPEDLTKHDVIIFAAPTRFGMMAAQMKSFLDSCGGIWFSGATVGKVAGVITSTATQHGGQESTILSFHTILLHFGFLIGGLPYSFTEQNGIDEVNGCSPYGASTIAGGQGQRQPSETELKGAKFQAEHLTKIGAKLFK